MQAQFWRRWTSAFAVACALGVVSSSAFADYALKTTFAIPTSFNNNVGGLFNSFDVSFFDLTEPT